MRRLRQMIESSFSLRMSLYILMVAASVFILAFWGYFNQARNSVREEAMEQAQVKLDNVILQIDKVLSSVETAVRYVVGDEEERRGIALFFMHQRAHRLVNAAGEFRFALSMIVWNPVHPEEVIALDGLVPDRFVLLAPDAPPVSRNVGIEHLLRPFRLVRHKTREIKTLMPCVYVVVACHEEFRDDMAVGCPVFREHASPCVGV